MKIIVQLVVCDDEDHQETLTNVVDLEKVCQRIGEVGLTLAEAKALLSALQQQHPYVSSPRHLTHTGRLRRWNAASS
jgi:hypothetical protein